MIFLPSTVKVYKIWHWENLKITIFWDRGSRKHICGVGIWKVFGFPITNAIRNSEFEITNWSPTAPANRTCNPCGNVYGLSCVSHLHSHHLQQKQRDTRTRTYWCTLPSLGGPNDCEFGFNAALAFDQIPIGRILEILQWNELLRSTVTILRGEPA